MERTDKIGIGGVFEIRHYDPYGKLKEVIEVHNTVSTAGLGHVSGLINDQESTHFKWLAVGDSSTAAATGNTALANEITANGLGRAAATASQVTTDDTDDTAQLVHTWTASGTQAVREAGIFDTSTASSGTMLARTTFSAKNMETDDTFEVTYKVDLD